MDRKYKKLMRTFDAVSKDGVVYTINAFTEYIEISTQTGGGPKVMEGLKSLRTSEGERVNRVEKGRYRIVGPPEIKLTSGEPGAP